MQPCDPGLWQPSCRLHISCFQELILTPLICVIQDYDPTICDSFFMNPGKQALNLNGAAFMVFVTGSKYGMLVGTELWLNTLLPQQTIWASFRTAHVCDSPHDLQASESMRKSRNLSKWRLSTRNLVDFQRSTCIKWLFHACTSGRETRPASLTRLWNQSPGSQFQNHP